jgi:hypothetical protein
VKPATGCVASSSTHADRAAIHPCPILSLELLRLATTRFGLRPDNEIPTVCRAGRRIRFFRLCCSGYRDRLGRCGRLSAARSSSRWERGFQPLSCQLSAVPYVTTSSTCATASNRDPLPKQHSPLLTDADSISVGFRSAPIGTPANLAFPEQCQFFCSELWWGSNWVPKHNPPPGSPLRTWPPHGFGGGMSG